MACFGGADAATRAFATKLQAKLGWSQRFALRAIDEYRKFLYLGVVADFRVTPSKVIDQVWHEHLLFTKAYAEFCRDVLGRPFEHFPELVPTEDQTSTFASQYEATLDLYEDEFNTSPPEQIWSTPKFKSDVARTRRALRRRGDPHESSGDDAPLYMYFDGGVASGGLSADSMPEFGGGGGFSGAGGESSWADSVAEAVASGEGGSGSSGGDSGSDGGGSGCSSGCGGE
jgi:hypothetical protein